mgnify:CR=1 FL=1
MGYRHHKLNVWYMYKRLLRQQVALKIRQMFCLQVQYMFMNFILGLIMRLGKVTKFILDISFQKLQDRQLRDKKNFTCKVFSIYVENIFFFKGDIKNEEKLFTSFSDKLSNFCIFLNSRLS